MRLQRRLSRILPLVLNCTEIKIKDEKDHTIHRLFNLNFCFLTASDC